MLLRSSFNRDLRRFHAVKEVLYNSGRTEAALPPLLTADHLHRDLSPCSRALPLSAQMSFSKRSSDRKVEPQLWNQPLYVVTRNQLLSLYFKLKRIWMRIFPPFVRFHGDTVLDWGRSWVCQCPKYTRVGCKWRDRGDVMTAGQSSSCFSEPREELVFSLHMASGCSMATIPSLHFTCTHMSSCEPMCGNYSRVRASPEIFLVALWQPGNLQQFLRSVLPKIFKEPLIYLLQPCSLWEPR